MREKMCLERKGYSLFRLNTKKEGGFTLVEAVLTLVILGFMGSMLALFGSRMVESSMSPVIQTQQMYMLRQVMENITLDYASLALEEKNPLCELAVRILPEDADAETNYGAYRSSVRFVKPAFGGTYFSLVPTEVPLTSCNGHPSSTDVALLEVVLFPYDSNSHVQLRSLFAAP
ncbi:type II secretion system protein [Halodesulfovibrio sp.]|jgi:type II secretory pathway pseudopilin PulG|uniref:type II secretion system protein n=1 Tax=Halodesulfovibrio sp. TaxID=1912772 RepID=UPI0025F71E1A|nr:type II secretion system protein [Halodesulfovibrio sp.]MCT4627883.1 type II secretion system GspH family protein [Halodesulfovibrio sp.]